MAPAYATFFRCCCEVCDRVSALVYTHWGDSGVPSELSESSQQAHQPLSPLMSYFARSGVFSMLTPHSPAGNALIPDSTTSSKGLPLSGQNSTVVPPPRPSALSQILSTPWMEEGDKREEMILNGVAFGREEWDRVGEGESDQSTLCTRLQCQNEPHYCT